MEQTTSYIMSFLAIVSLLCILVGGILLINLIQKAFSQDGVLWGLISMLFPPGTYLYARKNWEQHGRTFVITSSLLVIGLILWTIIKFSS